MTSLNEQRRRDEVEITIQKILDNGKQGHNHFLQPAISMVPRMYRDQNPSCFDPHVISIGPLHRKHENVQEYEGLKVTFLHDLLARLDSPPKQILEACFSKVSGSIKEVKEFYGRGVMSYDNLELANMMVTDACFILEFLYTWCEKGFSENLFVNVSIISDLVLLENQIPFFVLQDIFNCTLLNCAQSPSLMTMLHRFIDSIKPFKHELQIDNLSSDRFKHILDILHKAYQLPASTCVVSSGVFPMHSNHSTVELDLAGMNFKPNLDGDWPLAMKYETSSWLVCFHQSTLGMPVINIDDQTELILRNLIAYEQYCSVNGYYFSSYAYAMDSLVDSTEDVVKLVESKVILNYIGSNESAANLFNGLCKSVTVGNFYYESQWKQLDDYYNRYWPKNIARLKRTYFNSPWNMIALVAVTLLFALTVIQTWFTIKPSS